MKSMPAFSATALLILLSSVPHVSAEENSPVRNALETVFSPQRAPAQKTMGLLQRSFLDLVEQSQPKLELALVIDGTDSMGESLQGVRDAISRMTDDINLYKSGNLAIQIVVFRDEGSPSGAVSLPLQVPQNGFTSNREAVKEALGRVTSESGAPYFPEQVDWGVHTALRELKWSTDSDTSRWIFLFTDAPPFEPNFDESENQARRRVDTQVLVDYAREKGIRINTILCPSRAEDYKLYERGLDQTRDFLNRLTNGTDGVMLDLSYADIRTAIEKAAKIPIAPQAQIGPISRADIEAKRRVLADSKQPEAVNQRLRLAILPHGDLKKMNLQASEQAVQFATELAQTWRTAGADVVNPMFVKRALQLLVRRNLEGPALLQALANQLDVDYVVWGDLRVEPNATSLTSSFFDRNDGQIVMEASEKERPDVPIGQLSGRVTMKMIRSAMAKRPQIDQRLVAVGQHVQDVPALQTAIVTPVAGDAATRSHVLTGLHQLEMALAYPAGSAEALPLLTSARDALQKAVKDQSPLTRAWPQVLLASCQYNLWSFYHQNGDVDEAESARAEYHTALRAAFGGRDRLPLKSMKDEITADFALLSEKNYAEAIRLYETLCTVEDDNVLSTALRAHWMLTGVYLGDWGVPAEFKDTAKARQHALEILAAWDDSPEAKAIKQYQRYDEREGVTRNPNLPLLHSQLSTP